LRLIDLNLPTQYLIETISPSISNCYLGLIIIIKLFPVYGNVYNIFACITTIPVPVKNKINVRQK